MRFKYYIRGFGLGIILTTIILAVSFKIHGGMTEEQIRKEAYKLGMVDSTTENQGGNDSLKPSTEKNDKTNNNDKTNKVDESSESQMDTASENNKPNQDTQKPDDSSQKPDDNSQKPGDNSQDNSQKPEEDTSKPDSNDKNSETESENNPQGYVYIVIENGDTCRMVGQKLLDKGAITDVEEFRDYMSKKHYANKLHIGTYKIPLGGTFDDIAKVLIWTEDL